MNRRHEVAVTTEDIIAAAAGLKSQRTASPPGRRGVGEVTLKLENADANRLLWSTQQRLYGIVVAARGTSQSAVLEVKTSAGTMKLRVGSRLDGVLDDVEIYRASTSGTAGDVELKVLQSPDAQYSEDAEAGAGVDGGTVQYTALQSSVLNIPSDASPRTVGVPLSGGKGVRAIVSAPVGQTVTALTIVWWLRDPVVGRWAEGPTQEVLSTGRRDIAGADQFVQVADGEAFAEVRSSTSSGAGNFDVTLKAN